MESLTCPPYTPTQHLEREQALAKQFAEILHFTLRFDELKVPADSMLLSRTNFHIRGIKKLKKLLIALFWELLIKMCNLFR